MMVLSGEEGGPTRSLRGILPSSPRDRASGLFDALPGVALSRGSETPGSVRGGIVVDQGELLAAPATTSLSGPRGPGPCDSCRRPGGFRPRLEEDGVWGVRHCRGRPVPPLRSASHWRERHEPRTSSAREDRAASGRARRKVNTGAVDCLAGRAGSPPGSHPRESHSGLGRITKQCGVHLLRRVRSESEEQDLIEASRADRRTNHGRSVNQRGSPARPEVRGALEERTSWRGYRGHREGSRGSGRAIRPLASRHGSPKITGNVFFLRCTRP
jgi:hypothetical protein